MKQLQIYETSRLVINNRDFLDLLLFDGASRNVVYFLVFVSR